MDLGNVRQNLANGAYNDPTEFTKDMRLMFSNSKSFNTNKRSRIYAMTLRLSAMFAERIKDVLTSWKRAMKQNRKCYKNGYACCLVACTMTGKSVWSKLINTHVVFLAHLSRRLLGELLVYQSLHRPSVRQHFQTSPLKPQGQLNSNFIWRLLRMGEQKFVQMVLVT